MISFSEKFYKSERLCSQKIIEHLFKEGKIIYTDLLKVVWEPSLLQTSFPAQVAFSVSKRSFKLAVTRNLIKRRMREAYRKNKHLLYNHLEKENTRIVLVIIYRKNTIDNFHTMESAIKELFAKLSKIIR